MSLFTSPATRVFNSENSESMIQRKPGVLSSRKPFVDRSVNCNTPDVNRKQKLNIPLKEDINKTSPCDGVIDDLEINPEYQFTFKEVESEIEEFVPVSKRLEERDVYDILKGYLSDSTPPLSPLSAGEPLELTQFDYSYVSFTPNSSYDDDNSSYDDDSVVKLPACDSYDDDSVVKLPECDQAGFEYQIELPVFDVDNL